MPAINTPEINKSEVYKRINSEITEALNTGKLDVLSRHISPNLVDHGMPPGMPGGIEGVKAFTTMWRAAFPDGRWTIQDTMVDGDRLSCRTSFTGTQKGSLMGIPPTNKRVNLEMNDWTRFQGDKCVEHWGSIDMASIQQQLGLLPAPGVNHTQTVQRLYGCFQRGDVASIVAQCTENVDWRNDRVASSECPWNGNYSGRKNLPGFFKAVADSLELSAARPAGANSMVTHVWVAEQSITQIEPGALRDIVSDPALRGVIQNGAIYPDSGYSVRHEYGEWAHWESFLEPYLQWIRARWGAEGYRSPTRAATSPSSWAAPPTR
jgi:predicted ester cyclase